MIAIFIGELYAPIGRQIDLVDLELNIDLTHRERVNIVEWVKQKKEAGNKIILTKEFTEKVHTLRRYQEI